MNTSGYANTAIGNQALFLNTSGYENTAIGYEALLYNTNGSDNTAIGDVALLSNTSGVNNTAIGVGALQMNTSGSYNTANGAEALYSNTNGTYNTAIGELALEWLNTGNNNIALGFAAGNNLTTGSDNIDIGNTGLSTDTNIIRIGSSQSAAYIAGVINGDGGGLTNLNASAAQLIGTVANSQLANSSITVNAGTGLSGGGAVALGGSTTLNNAGVLSVTGNADITASTVGGAVTLGDTATSSATPATLVKRDAVGSFSATDLTLNGALNLPATTATAGIIYSGGLRLIHAYGPQNFFAGPGAGNLTMSGAGNAGNGYGALFSNTNGFDNTAIGYEALKSNTGDSLGDGSANTAVGFETLFNNTTGSGNIALGYEAGFNITTGTNNIEIGNMGASTDTNTIRIGTTNVQIKTFIAGIFGATVGGSAVTVNSSGQLGVAPSSQRFKQDIQSMDDASSVLLSLRPVTFKYKPGIDPEGTPQFGLVAEEVAKVDPDLVVRDGKEQIFTVRYEAVNAMLLNEFLKEHRRVREQSAEIENLKTKAGKVDSLEKRLKELEKAVARMTQKSGATVALSSTTAANE